MPLSFTPFSNNIIFLDTEFSTLDPYKGEVLSIGLVKLTGEELYLELEYDGPVNAWVKENILPTLNATKVSRKIVVEKISEFIGQDKPYVVSYVNQFDIVYTHKLFASDDIHDLPFFWLPIDFASILFGMGIDPEAYLHNNKANFFQAIGIDTVKFKHTHNALDDARLLREAYLKMTNK